MIALAAACLCLVLSACRGGGAPAPTVLPGEPARESRSEPVRAFARSVGFYYPQADGLALERRTAEIVCEEGMWLPEVLTRTLLEPVDDPDLLTPFGGNAELRSIASCNEMLVVELDYSESIDAGTLHASALALARTLIRETGAESVLLLKDGARVRLKGVMTNPVRREVCENEQIWEAQTAFLQKGFVPDEYAGGVSVQTEPRILFYPDETGNFILCSETGDPAGRMTETVLEEILHQSPDGELTSLAERYGLGLQACSRENLGDGRIGLAVELSAPESLLSDTEALRRIRAILYLNVRSNDSTLAALSLTVADRSVQEILGDYETWYAGENVREQFGEEITLYFLSSDRQSLVPVRRTVSFSDSISPEAWMRELLKGPGAHDPGNVRSVFPDGFGPEELLYVETDGINAVVNFTSELEDVYPTGDETMERMMVYAIVNTLTEDAWIQRVLLRVDSRQVDSLGGSLYLGTPLMRNPGLIKTTEEKNP